MTKKKKKISPRPRKPKLNLMSGMPRPKPVSFSGSTEILQQARNFPILGCWVMEGWQDGGLTPVVVARKQPEEKVVFGSFLVDLLCLGVKDALWKSDVSLKQFERDLPHLCSEMPEPCDASLAHELIYGSIDFARRYGFEPHRDFTQASLVLDPPGAHPRKHKVKFGKGGKPFFVSGPYDDARQILDQLMRTAGEGNFDYMVGFGSPDEL